MDSLFALFGLAVVIGLLLWAASQKRPAPRNSNLRGDAFNKPSPAQWGASIEPARERPVGPAQTIEAGGVKLTVQAFFREKSAEEERGSELLKEATRKKAAKDIDGAILSLREAYPLLERSAAVYPIDTYLRLPLYLQRAGRFEEAQQEFQALLAGVDARTTRECVQDAETRKGFAAMRRAGIYRGMYTAYRREGKANHVALFNLLSDACNCVGLNHYKGDELRFMRSKRAWKESADSLFGDTALAPQQDAIIEACILFSKRCTHEAFVELESTLSALILGIGEQSRPVAVSACEPPCAAPIEKVDASPAPESVSSEAKEGDRMDWLDAATRIHLTAARDAWKAGDFAAARLSYLKTAQALTQIEGADRAKASLKQEQIDFAKADPLYQQLMAALRPGETVTFRLAKAALRPIVNGEPGILQTAIYGRLPFSREDIGYALYFGHELGDVYRRKKGRTYEVLPAGVTIDQR